MKRQIVGMAASLVCLVTAGTGSVRAQGAYSGIPHYTSPYQNNSGLSPYLNLLRGGDTAANYYLGVIPEFQRRANYDQLRTAIQEIDQRLSTPLGEGFDLGKPLDRTGHATAFGYYSSYYPINPYRPGAPQGAAGANRPR